MTKPPEDVYIIGDIVKTTGKRKANKSPYAIVKGFDGNKILVEPLDKYGNRRQRRAKFARERKKGK